MNEFALIARLTQGLPTNSSVVAGPGDDCAVLDLGIPDRFVLFKTDAVVEGIHFDASARPEQIGHKALARCLSDIAAMAGTPNSALVTLGLPPNWNAAHLERVYAGMNALATKHSVAIVGGETTSNPDRFLVSIALLGTVEKARCILRSGAKPGDAIFVSGNLGGSLAGRHLEFEPRLTEARWLAAHFKPSAMIDLSDGLAGDLRHILQASGVGAELFGPSLPISREAKLRARANTTAKPALVAALTDGEDFELLFTLPRQLAVSVLDGWKAQFPQLPLTCIGKISGQPGLFLRDREGRRPLNLHGYDHFQQP